MQKTFNGKIFKKIYIKPFMCYNKYILVYKKGGTYGKE